LKRFISVFECTLKLKYIHKFNLFWNEVIWIIFTAKYIQQAATMKYKID